METQNTRSMISQFQTLLYTYPLYEYSRDGQIAILVVGWNQAAQTFLDLALEAGQIARRTKDGTVWYGLTLTSAAAHPDERRALYLDSRPGLKEFVDVSSPGNPAQERAGSYGAVRMTDDASLPGLLRSGAYRYVVICGDSPEACRETGEQCAGALGGQPQSMIVLAASQDGENGLVLTRQGREYQPVAGGEADDANARRLQNLAFNAHLVWGLQPNGDIAKQREIFDDSKNDYFRRSSRSFAISIKSKLWSIGIEPSDDPEHADLENARAFQEKMEERDGRALFHLLMAMEQRRWVMEKVTQGFSNRYIRGEDENNRALFEDLVGNASLKQDKMNLYILRCNEDARLDDDPGYWTGQGAADLDDLDALSVDYYRFVCEKRDALRKIKDLFSAGDISDLRARVNRLRPSIKLNAELNRYIFCLHAILDGSRTYAKQYSVIERDFLSRVEEHRLNDPGLRTEKDAIRSAVRALYTKFFPAVEAALRRSFKMNNEALIRNIPFVLTYQPSACLVMPFDAAPRRSEINRHIYNNLASPVMIKPGKLVYLYRAHPHTDVDLLVSMLRSCVTHLKRHYRITCPVYLAVFRLADAGGEKKEKLESELEMLKAGRYLKDYFLPEQADGGFLDSVGQIAGNTAILYDGTTPLFASMRENAEWTRQIPERWGYFELDAAAKGFTYTTEACEWLKYMLDRSFLRVDDMLRLTGGEHRAHKYPNYTELVYASENDNGEPAALYERLWRIYKGDRVAYAINDSTPIGIWNRMCSVLDGDNLMLLEAGSFTDPAGISFSGLTRWARGAQYLSLSDIGGVTALLKTLASIRAVSQNGGRIPLLWLDCDSKGNILSIHSNHQGMIEILSQAGMILEVYVYFKAFETGYFDDIACGCEFFWGDRKEEMSHKNNEIDLILTKDFRSIIVECKGTARLDQNYYHKLNSLAGLFGINAKKVMVAYTHGNDAEELNQIARGALMDITTIKNSEGEIDDIGNKLKEIMEA